MAVRFREMELSRAACGCLSRGDQEPALRGVTVDDRGCPGGRRGLSIRGWDGTRVPVQRGGEWADVEEGFVPAGGRAGGARVHDAIGCVFRGRVGFRDGVSLQRRIRPGARRSSRRELQSDDAGALRAAFEGQGGARIHRARLRGAADRRPGEGPAPGRAARRMRFRIRHPPGSGFFSWPAAPPRR